MSNAMIEDYIYEFKAPNGVQSKCRIRTFLAQTFFHKNDLVVICSQLADDEEAGMSVTNAAECIATGVMYRHQIQPMRMIWIEHYPPRGTIRIGKHEFDETLDRVTFDVTTGRIPGGCEPMSTMRGQIVLAHAKWTHRIPRWYVEELIGEKFQ